MASDANINPKNPAAKPAAPDVKGIKIFTYPKIIFIWPSVVMALICGIGMMLIGDDTVDPTKQATATVTTKDAKAPAQITTDSDGQIQIVRRFTSWQNLLALAFLVVFAFNLLIMAVDFPRFTIIAIILAGAAIVFFLLWLNLHWKIVPPLVRFMENVYVAANSGFYFVFATITLIVFAIIYGTRFLDYWVILPNEILHNHGPFSDLERFPTFNLKFDKEIPDILEYALLRSGRLVLHVANERRAIVLDNVLWIEHKEQKLKQLMRTMEVRVTTDQEMAET